MLTKPGRGFCFTSQDLQKAGFNLNPDRPGHVTLTLGQQLLNQGYNMLDWAMTKEAVQAEADQPNALQAPSRYSGIVDLLARLGSWGEWGK